MTSETDPNDLGNSIDDAAADASGDDVGELKRLLAINQDAALRASADLDNLQKRFRRELDNGKEAERCRVLSCWVESIDDLERALAFVDRVERRADGQQAVDTTAVGSEADAIGEGVRTIVNKAVAAVEGFGYPRFGAPGDPFDPELHQVVSTVPAGGELPGNVVLAVISPGYGTAEALLRPASVVVVKDDD